MELCSVRWRKAIALSGCILAMPALASDPDSREAYAAVADLLQEGNTSEAFETAQGLEEEHGGTLEFDFLLGMAAMGEKEFNTAAFAFQRILIVQPNHHRARLEFARSQYFLGNIAEAKYQFDLVLTSNPPEAIRENVDRFMQAIDELQAAQSHDFNLKLSLAGGFDTNINSATDRESFDLFGLRFQIAESGREKDSAFVRLGADAGYRYRLSQTQSLYSTVAVEQKNNIDTNDFDLWDSAIRGGYRQRFGDHWLSGGLKYQHYWLDNDQLLYSAGLEGQWSHRADNMMPYSFLSASAIRYPGNATQDRNQYMGGAGVQFGARGLDLNLSAYLGHEPATESRFDPNGRNHLGVNLAVSGQPIEGQKVKFDLGYSITRHHEEQALFSKKREDDRSLAKLSWQMELAPSLALTASASYRKNNSNISVYGYDQWLAETGITYQAF